MTRFTRSLPAGVLLVVALLVFVPGRTGYGQSPGGGAGQVAQCQPFQQSLALELLPGSSASTGTIGVTQRTAITIEQIGLRIDAFNFVAPAVAAVVTSVRSVVTAYYLPIPIDLGLVLPPRPLTLMQAGPLHADSGSNVTLALEIDQRYLNGNGRAVWSISGTSCTA
jgi:hypothetical protein